MDGYLSRRRQDPRYASERSSSVFVPPSSAFTLERYHASAKAESKEHDGPDKTIKKKKKGIYKKGEDADGDGKTGEGKEKHSKEEWDGDSDGDGVPDAIDKDKKKKKEKKSDD